MKQSSKKVFILGTDKIGWSIDKDRMYTIRAIEQLDNYQLTTSFIKADIVYVVWWNQLLTLKYRILSFIFKKKIIACITNDLSHQSHIIKRLLNSIDIFVYANSQQKSFLANNGINNSRLYFNPFYVDENIFKRLSTSKIELCQKFNINSKDVDNRILVGSFQRDSLGTDLSKPKWQKDPDMLIKIIEKVDRERVVLVLAGPRRHYIVNQCKKLNIKYIYVGDETYIENNLDDLRINPIKIEDMPYLYNLVDLYIVSSKSEGGPKAIPESILCNTKVISTDVGFAKDLLDDKDIYYTAKEAALKINAYDRLEKYSKQDFMIKKYYKFEYFRDRVRNILEGLEL